jgi:plastocyanin
METQENVNVGAKKPKKLMFILAAALIVIVIVLIAVLAGKKNTTQTNNNPEANTAGNQEAVNTSTPEASTPSNTASLQEANIANLEGAKVVVPGANPITTDNKVVTATGQITENNAQPMTDTAPKQTGFLNKEEISKDVAGISVGNNKFSPASFSTKVGAPTTFTLTGVDSYSHVIAFDDQSLSAIAILVGPGQTKAITFNAPTTAGEYTFRCASPGHAEAGEVGKMIVK